MKVERGQLESEKFIKFSFKLKNKKKNRYPYDSIYCCVGWVKKDFFFFFFFFLIEEPII